MAAGFLTMTAACGGPQTFTTPKAAGASTAEVEVLTPAAADVGGVEAANMSWIGLPSTCPPVAINDDGMRFVTIRSTGVSWATARFAPSKGCKIYEGPTVDQRSPQVVDPKVVTDFTPQTDGCSPLAVFERPAGGQWSMNTFGQAPFPCPGLGGVAPGQGNKAVPQAVLVAWKLPYVANCSSAQYIPRSGH